MVAYVGTTGAATGLSIDVTLAEVPFVANGIAQAQYNYIKRNQHNVSQTELYKNLTTKLQQKLCGFTSKHLLDLSAESRLTGDFGILCRTLLCLQLLRIYYIFLFVDLK